MPHLQIISNEPGGIEVMIDNTTYAYAIDDIYKPSILNHYNHSRFGRAVSELEKYKHGSWKIKSVKTKRRE